MRMLAVALLFLVVIAYLFTWGSQVGERTVISGSKAIIPIILWIMAIVVALSAHARRLHDRGHSAWWMIAWIIAVFVCMSLYQTTLNVNGVLTVYRPFGDGLFSAIPVLAALGLVVFALVELGVRRGSMGENKYGPDPVSGATVSPETFE